MMIEGKHVPGLYRADVALVFENGAFTRWEHAEIRVDEDHIIRLAPGSHPSWDVYDVQRIVGWRIRGLILQAPFTPPIEPDHTKKGWGYSTITLDVNAPLGILNDS